MQEIMKNSFFQLLFVYAVVLFLGKPSMNGKDYRDLNSLAFRPKDPEKCVLIRELGIEIQKTRGIQLYGLN